MRQKAAVAEVQGSTALQLAQAGAQVEQVRAERDGAGAEASEV